MSNAVESAGKSGGGDRPAKKPKHNEIVAFGGPMDDEETARKKLEEAGFDPDKPVNSISEIEVEVGGFSDDYLPMSYFCQIGDLMMCRYLLSKGASTSWVVDNDDNDDDENSGWSFHYWASPMYAAAYGGHLEVCKWLCNHGARNDVRKSSNFYDSPLHIAIRHMQGANDLPADGCDQHLKVCRWLILNEALCPNNDGVVCKDRIREAFRSNRGEIIMFNWASDALKEHDRFMVFLMGTHIPVPFSTEELVKLLNKKLRSADSVSAIIESLSEHQQHYIWKKEQRRPSIVQCLSGHPGIRKHIADMIGVVRGRDLRILRSLERGLTSHFEEVV